MQAAVTKMFVTICAARSHGGRPFVFRTAILPLSDDVIMLLDNVIVTITALTAQRRIGTESSAMLRYWPQRVTSI